MWNFTGRAALLPNLNGIEHLLHDDKACLEPQGSIKELKAEQVFLGMLNLLQCMCTCIICLEELKILSSPAYTIDNNQYYFQNKTRKSKYEHCLPSIVNLEFLFHSVEFAI